MEDVMTGKLKQRLLARLARALAPHLAQHIAPLIVGEITGLMALRAEKARFGFFKTEDGARAAPGEKNKLIWEVLKLAFPLPETAARPCPDRARAEIPPLRPRAAA
jgi:hypothetical protein